MEIEGCFSWPWWHRRLLAEGNSHADVIVTARDNQRLKRHMEAVNAIQEEAAKLEKAEFELIAARTLADRAGVGDSGVCGPLYRWRIKRKLAAARKQQRQALTEEALLETLDPWRRGRLLAELKVQEELTGVGSTLFSVFFGVEQKPTQTRPRVRHSSGF